MRIFKCKSCPRIHIEIGNVLMHIENRQQLQSYLAGLNGIDTEFFSSINRNKGLIKDIFLPVSCNVNMSFTLEEFRQFKQMIQNYLDDKPSSLIHLSKFSKPEMIFPLN